jgi:hypothetical protein
MVTNANIPRDFYNLFMRDSTKGIIINIDRFTNYSISVNLNDSASIIFRNNKSLMVGNTTSTSWIVRYIFGMDDHAAAPKARTAVDITHLRFLENWLRRKLGTATLSIKGA